MMMETRPDHDDVWKIHHITVYYNAHSVTRVFLIEYNAYRDKWSAYEKPNDHFTFANLYTYGVPVVALYVKSFKKLLWRDYCDACDTGFTVFAYEEQRMCKLILKVYGNSKFKNFEKMISLRQVEKVKHFIYCCEDLNFSYIAICDALASIHDPQPEPLITERCSNE